MVCWQGQSVNGKGNTSLSLSLSLSLSTHTHTHKHTHSAQGNINLIEAAVRHGVKKFILVTSIGTGDSKAATPPNVYDVLKPVLLEKEKVRDLWLLIVDT